MGALTSLTPQVLGRWAALPAEAALTCISTWCPAGSQGLVVSSDPKASVLSHLPT